MRKVFLIDIVEPEADPNDIAYRFEELENLVNTYWWVVIVKKYQRKSYPNYKTFIWKGKLEELKHQMELEWADLLIIWNTLKPAQIYNIDEILRPIKAKAWDRIDLILKIFEKNAKSTESRLQTELAAMKHMWPRIFWMWMELSRQWWWIWTKWKWETNTQIMKTHIKESEKKIEEKLKNYAKTRQLHRQARQKKWLNTVSIVWYTNAWKSCLLNNLTKKWTLSEDKLFATLWTSVWSFYWIKKDKWIQILINDTIWFISDLPPNLIKAFSSTLEDSSQSQLLIHLIDITDRKILEKINIVDDILENIWANQKKLYVFNKTDLVDRNTINKIKKEYKKYNPIFISAAKWEWIENLKEKMIDIFI